SLTAGGFATGATTLTVNASSIARNSTTGQGGGIYNDGPANFTNDTIAGNSASSGGGLYDDSNLGTPPGLVLVSCTVAGNSATGPGGGITQVANVRTPTSLKNTIVASNTAKMANDISGPLVTTSDHNLVGD